MQKPSSVGGAEKGKPENTIIIIITYTWVSLIGWTQVPNTNGAHNKSIGHPIFAINMDLNIMGFGPDSVRPNPRIRLFPPRLRLQSTPHRCRRRRRRSTLLSSDRRLQNRQDFSSLHCFNRYCSLGCLHLSHASPWPHAAWPRWTDRP